MKVGDASELSWVIGSSFPLAEDLYDCWPRLGELVREE